MDLQLKGKRALITGGSKGIGLGAARVLAEEGCDLVLVARDAAGLDEAAQAVRLGAQVRVETVAADLSVSAEIARLAAAVGEIDILVNNAGAIPNGSIHVVDDDAWRASWDLKVYGYINVTRAFYPALKARKGVVVNVIGAGSEILSPNYIAGATGNAALVAFTRALGRGTEADGVRVVGVNPGPVATERMISYRKAAARNRFGDESRWLEFYETDPFGRPATPEELGAAVAFLASPRAAYINATVLTVDGGKMAWA